MKNLRVLSTAVIAAMAIMLSSSICASNGESANRNFHSICFGDGINIEMVSGSTPSIESSDSTLRYSIIDGVLTLTHDSANSNTANVRICAPSIKSLQYSGNTFAKVYGKISADNLLISVSGDGDLNLSDASANNTVCAVLGDGDIRFTNLSSRHITLSIYGNGKVISNGKQL